MIKKASRSKLFKPKGSIKHPLVYLRKEKLDRLPEDVSRYFQIVGYRDRMANSPMVKWLYFFDNKPDKRNKTIIINDQKWSACWLADKI